MGVTLEQLESIAASVWGSVVGLPFDGGDASRGPEPGPTRVLGTIGIGGDRNYTLSLSSSAEGAKKVAAQMFRIEAGAVSFDDVRDAMGEVVNVLSGNLKPLVRGQCLLALPTVREASAGDCTSADTVLRVKFCSEGEEFQLRLCGKPA